MLSPDANNFASQLLESCTETRRLAREKGLALSAASQHLRQQMHCLEIVNYDVLGYTCPFAALGEAEVDVARPSVKVERALP